MAANILGHISPAAIGREATTTAPLTAAGTAGGVVLPFRRRIAETIADIGVADRGVHDNDVVVGSILGHGHRDVALCGDAERSANRGAAAGTAQEGSPVIGYIVSRDGVVRVGWHHQIIGARVILYGITSSTIGTIDSDGVAGRHSINIGCRTVRVRAGLGSIRQLSVNRQETSAKNEEDDGPDLDRFFFHYEMLAVKHT